MNFGKTLMDASSDVNKFNGTISGLGDQVLSVSKNFGVLGQVIGLSIKAFTSLTTAALNQTTIMVKAFDDLSEVGATTFETSESIRKLGRDAGYSGESLLRITGITKTLGTDLMGLGEGAGKGAKTFLQIANVGNKTYEAFNRLGLSQEQVTQAQATFVKQSNMANAIGRKTPEELRKASLDYLDTLVKLRDLTGMSVEKQQAALDAALAQENFNTYINTRQLEVIELDKKIAAEKDDNRKKELQASKLAIENEIKQKNQLAIMSSQLGEKDRTAFLQGISTSGETIFTEGVARLQYIAGVNVSEINRAAIQNKDALGVFIKEFAKAPNQINSVFGELISSTGDQGIEMRRILGVSVETQKFANQLNQLLGEGDLEKLRAAIDQNIKSRKEEGSIINSLGERVADGGKNTQNAMLTAGREFNKIVSDATAALNPFTSETKLAAAASTALMIAASGAAGVLGILASGKIIGGIRGLLGGAAGASGAAAGASGAAAAAAGGSMLGRVGGFAKGLLGKVALPILAGTTLYDAAKGFGADSSAGFGSKLLNAGSSALSGLSFGMLGSSAEEIKKRAEAGAGKLGESATTTTAEGGQKAVNVNVVSSIPLNVNIEKVLDPLFRMAQNPKTQSESAGALPPGIQVPGVTSAQEFGTRSKIATQAISSQMTTVLSGAANVSSYTESDLRQMGLNLKKGDVQREGAGIDARLIELAKTLQNMIPGITFTGFADQYHAEKAPNSEHNRGRAFDFVLPPKLAQDAEYRSQLVKELNSMGAFVIDEYSYPSAKSTGGHIHVAITTGNKSQAKPMARGGMILGPGSSTSDSVPAFNGDTGQPIALSTGEYVLPASVTSMLGRGYLDSLISSPNTLKRQGGGSIPGEDGQRVISAAVDLGEGMREIIYSDGSRELSGGFGTRFFDASGKLVKTRTPNFAGLYKEIHADGGVDTHYAAGPLSFSQYASGRRSASYNLGMAKISSDTEKGNMIDIFNEDRTERLTSIEQVNSLLEQYKNDDSEMKTVLESVKEIFQQMMDKNESLFTEMNSTLKDVVGELEESNSTQEDILNYSRI